MAHCVRCCSRTRKQSSARSSSTSTISPSAACPAESYRHPARAIHRPRQSSRQQISSQVIRCSIHDSRSFVQISSSLEPSGSAVPKECIEFKVLTSPKGSAKAGAGQKGPIPPSAAQRWKTSTLAICARSLAQCRRFRHRTLEYSPPTVRRSRRGVAGGKRAQRASVNQKERSNESDAQAIRLPRCRT